MLPRWTAVVAVIGTAWAARAGDAGAPCALARADRAHTGSASCQACHDGSGGPGIGTSHPVEVDYASAAARAPDRFEPPGALRREIVLVDGRVTCTSCHDATSAQPRHAAAPRLCQACHRL